MTLQLTPQQQNILDGNEGPARKLAMEILVKVGEGFGAQRLIQSKVYIWYCTHTRALLMLA